MADEHSNSKISNPENPNINLANFEKRKTAYDPEMAERILTHIANGLTLTRALKEIPDAPHIVVIYRWQRGMYGAPDQFNADYESAKRDRSHALVDEIQAITNDTHAYAHRIATEAVKRLDTEPIRGMSPKAMYDLVYAKADKFISMNVNGRKYLAAKLNPAVYSDKQIIAHEIAKPIVLETAGLSTEALEKIAELQEQIIAMQEKG